MHAHRGAVAGACRHSSGDGVVSASGIVVSCGPAATVRLPSFTNGRRRCTGVSTMGAAAYRGAAHCAASCRGRWGMKRRRTRGRPTACLAFHGLAAAGVWPRQASRRFRLAGEHALGPRAARFTHGTGPCAPATSPRRSRGARLGNSADHAELLGLGRAFHRRITDGGLAGLDVSRQAAKPVRLPNHLDGHVVPMGRLGHRQAHG